MTFWNPGGHPRDRFPDLAEHLTDRAVEDWQQHSLCLCGCGSKTNPVNSGNHGSTQRRYWRSGHDYRFKIAAGETPLISGKLPPYEELRRLFLTGHSLTDLALKFDCTTGAVLMRLRTETRARGLQWPIPTPPGLTAFKRRKGQTGVSVPADTVIRALREFNAVRVVPWDEVAERAGVHPSWLRDLHNGRYARIRRDKAGAVLHAIGRPVPPTLVKQPSKVERAKRSRKVPA